MPRFMPTHEDMDNLLKKHPINQFDNFELEEFFNMIYKTFQDTNSYRKVRLVEGRCRDKKAYLKVDFDVDIKWTDKGFLVQTDQIDHILKKPMTEAINTKKLDFDKQEETWFLHLNVKSKDNCEVVFKQDGKIKLREKYTMQNPLYNILLMHEHVEAMIESLEVLFVFNITNKEEMPIENDVKTKKKKKKDKEVQDEPKGFSFL